MEDRKVAYKDYYQKSIRSEEFLRDVALWKWLSVELYGCLKLKMYRISRHHHIITSHVDASVFR